MSEDIFILTEDSIRLHTHSSYAHEPKGAVLIVHGLSDYSGRYNRLSEFLVSNGLNTFRFDLRGYGRSDGLPGYIEEFEDYIKDMEAAVRHFTRLMAPLPLFVYGQSMGALVIAQYLRKGNNPFRGAIFSSGLFKVNEDLSPILQKMSSLLSVVVPRLKTIALDPSLLSRNEAVARAASDDPLHYTEGVRCRTGAEVIKATADMQNHLAEINYPILVLHGEEDHITRPEASELVFEEATVTDKTLKLYPGAMHELFNEINAGEYFGDVLEWIEERI